MRAVLGMMVLAVMSSALPSPLHEQVAWAKLGRNELLSLMDPAPVLDGTLITGNSSIDDGFELEWSISPTTIQFTLTWVGSGAAGWAAIGLHDNSPKGSGTSMSNAEVFMCSPTATNEKAQFCQVRNTLAGLVTPALDPTQYITLISSSQKQQGGNTISSATFSRTLTPVASSPLSCEIFRNQANNVIFARGSWLGNPMPQGTPAQHPANGAGATQIAFFGNGTLPPGPPPPPPPPPPAPAPGVGPWPDRFQANFTIVSADSHDGPASRTASFHSWMAYDFAKRSQLWAYTDIHTGQSAGGELWAGDMLYSFDGSGACNVTNMTFSILRPDWMNMTNYMTTNWLLRQPRLVHNEMIGITAPEFTYSDLRSAYNGIGMVNTWVVSKPNANDTTAESVRIEGPFVFTDTSKRLVLDFTTFTPMPHSTFGNGTFAVPAGCHKPPGFVPKVYGGGTPMGLMHSVGQALNV